MNDLMVKYGNGDQQEMSESDTSKIDSQDAKTSSETDTESEDSEKHNESSSSDDTEQESPVIVGSEDDEEEEEEDEEPSKVYLILIDGKIKGYQETEQAAENYIEKLAEDFEIYYNGLYPGWSVWTMHTEKYFYGNECGEIKLMFRYNFYIINYDRLEHTFRYRSISKLP